MTKREGWVESLNLLLERLPSLPIHHGTPSEETRTMAGLYSVVQDLSKRPLIPLLVVKEERVPLMNKGVNRLGLIRRQVEELHPDPWH